jgi:hypothetical protein
MNTPKAEIIADLIKIKSIWLNRAEGPHIECYDLTVANMKQANDVLTKWSKTAPIDGSIDKVDFRISWENGNIYEGTYGLQSNKVVQPNLAKHVIDFIAFHIGLHTPKHLTAIQHKEYLQRSMTEDDTAKMWELFTEYSFN